MRFIRCFFLISLIVLISSTGVLAQAVHAEENTLRPGITLYSMFEPGDLLSNHDFFAEKGQAFTFTAALFGTPTMLPEITIFNPDGDVIINSDDVEHSEAIISGEGSYTVVGTRHFEIEETGLYTITVSRGTNAILQAYAVGAIEVFDGHNSTTNCVLTPDDSEYYSFFNIEAGETLYVVLDTTQPVEVVIKHTVSGQKWFSEDDSATGERLISFEAEDTATYRLVVSLLDPTVGQTTFSLTLNIINLEQR